MKKASSALIAAIAALTLSGSACAQSNNSLARPSVTSPVAAAVATGGYGTPGSTNSDSGNAAGARAGSPNSINSAAPAPTIWKSNNSLEQPSVTSPAAGQ